MFEGLLSADPSDAAEMEQTRVLEIQCELCGQRPSDRCAVEMWQGLSQGIVGPPLSKVCAGLSCSEQLCPSQVP